MGLHCGYLVATADPDTLLDELLRHTGEFEIGDRVERVEDADIDPGEFEMLLGGGSGKGYLLDTSMILSSDPDLIVALSSALGTVVGAGAETVSGSYWLTVARDGAAVRHVFVQHASMTAGLAIGDPLPFEAEYPLADSSGAGVFAAMDAYGLDPSSWLDSGPATIVTYDATRFPESGPIGALQHEHRREHERPDGEWLQEITVKVVEPPRRTGGAQDH
ncbi:hypothetical protein ACQP00_36635 [Dactylosporangium sp. CS-047395]|uniref:hypothetical protein n=1 Tax=Dactylosporangium sp. CS-047395 TaxID=3239936 RepID=UPI003D90E305